MMIGEVRKADREDARRQHRILGMYCALYCWHHQKEAVFVLKDTFLSFIGLQRLKKTRFESLVEDMAPYFPYCFEHKNEANSDLIVLSRIPKEELLNNKKMASRFSPSIFNVSDVYSKENDILSVLDDVNHTKNVDMIGEIFPYINSSVNIYEFSLSNALSMLTSGLIDPETVLKDRKSA